MIIGTVLAISTILFQVHWRLIPIQDWHEHWRLWVLSVVCPYILIVVPHLLWRLAESPWRIHQEAEAQHWKELEATTGKLVQSQNQNALLQERISSQTWPDKRPQITLDKWGHRVFGTKLQQEMGFYVTNHGETALEVTVEPFVLGTTKWVSSPLSTIESGQKDFILVWPDGRQPYEGANCWMALSIESRDSLCVQVRYRDFNNNWYRTTAQMKVKSFGCIELGASTQEKLGSS
jgi:hypothetical protein